jgi:hypothetical protein
LTKEQVADIIGLNLETNTWRINLESNEWPKYTIAGQVNGYDVQINVFLSDINDNSESEVDAVIGAEIGVLQFIVKSAEEHGMLPRFRSNASVAAGNNVQTEGGWKCPDHGNARIIEHKFKKGKMKCGYGEVVEDMNVIPEWSDGKPARSNKTQKWYWNCKREES